MNLTKLYHLEANFPNGSSSGIFVTKEELNKFLKGKPAKGYPFYIDEDAEDGIPLWPEYEVTETINPSAALTYTVSNEPILSVDPILKTAKALSGYDNYVDWYLRSMWDHKREIQK